MCVADERNAAYEMLVRLTGLNKADIHFSSEKSDASRKTVSARPQGLRIDTAICFGYALVFTQIRKD